MKITKDQKAITLIALVITIIVLLILAGVALASLTGNSSIIDNANYAVNEYQRTANEDQNVLVTVENLFAKYMGESSSAGDDDDTPTETPILKTESYIGRYADINGDGNIDGIIYIDLLDTAHLSGTWNNDSKGTFSITTDVTSNNVKDYVVSQTNQTDSRWNSTEPQDVIKLATTQTGTKERFYVMALDNLINEPQGGFYWYDGAYGNVTDYATVAPETNTGRENTAAIKAKWDIGTGAGGYGQQDIKDMWGYLPTGPRAGADPTAAEGDTEQYRWFIPSRAEWSAFGNNLEITADNIDEYGLYDEAYWTSSPSSSAWAYEADFYEDGTHIESDEMSCGRSVRFSATF